jgi:hypothetical protein
VNPERRPLTVDTSKAHPARRYNYWLHGKDNFAADRESAEVLAAAFPTIRLSALENRRFLRRAVAYLAGEAGIRQFLDIGAGLPSEGNVHEIAQACAPQSRVVYVDNDPIVLVHAHALLTSTPEGATAYLDADLRRPEEITSHPELLRTLDLSRPVALTLVAIMHFLRHEDDPYGVFQHLVGALPSGSHVVMSHATGDHFTPEDLTEAVEANERSGVTFQFRTRTEFARFFDGLELLPPGITSVVEWRPDVPPEQRPPIEDVSMLCAVARVP